MKSIEQWFDEYGESHQNPVNKAIHWVCVPLIFLSVIGLLAAIPADYIKDFFPGQGQRYIHWGSVVIFFALMFYLRLSFQIFVGMFFQSLLVLFLVGCLDDLSIPLWKSSLAIFVLAWVVQFIGHKIEGKKPSFFKDIQFLLIGPAWLLGFVYRRLGIPF